MSVKMNDDAYLAGHLLVAMPNMPDDRFSKSVIYMCAHNEEGAMGLVVNKPLETLSFPDLLEQLDIVPSGMSEPINVHFGGPVESGRGFVLHTPDYVQEATMVVDDHIALTATVDILQGHRRRYRAQEILVGAGLCRMGAGTIGFGNQIQRLAACRCRPGISCSARA